MSSVVTPSRISPGSAIYDSPKPREYFSCSRPELAALVPCDAVRILDIGCAAGQLAGTLRATRPSVKLEIVGIEVSPEAAKAAAATVDTVILGNIESIPLEFEKYFDCVILGDVLEHLVDPWSAVRKVEMLVRNSGTVIASIPNVQNWRVIVDLIRGRWEYREFGIMDSTHLRFFTKKAIHALFIGSGLLVTQISPLLTTTKARIIDKTTAGIVSSFLAHQYLVVAKPAGFRNTSSR